MVLEQKPIDPTTGGDYGVWARVSPIVAFRVESRVELLGLHGV